MKPRGRKEEEEEAVLKREHPEPPSPKRDKRQKD